MQASFNSLKIFQQQSGNETIQSPITKGIRNSKGGGHVCIYADLGELQRSTKLMIP